MKTLFKISLSLALVLPCQADLHSALSFHASYDGSTDANHARGETKLHVAPKWGHPRVGSPGLPPGETVLLDKGAGKFGDALRFKRKIDQLVYYPAEGNVAYRDKDWSGSVSFWLRVSPDADLEPGYCDTIQITSKDWDDASFFTEFTKDEKPREFRLGAYSDKNVWNADKRDWEKIPLAEKPLIRVERPPFRRDNWVHVAFTWEKFNTGKADGVVSLYLDGQPKGQMSPRQQTYTWEKGKSLIMLGFSYTGWLDDLAIFDRALSASEVKTLHGLTDGVKSLAPGK